MMPPPETVSLLPAALAHPERNMYTSAVLFAEMTLVTSINRGSERSISDTLLRKELFLMVFLLSYPWMIPCASIKTSKSVGNRGSRINRQYLEVCKEGPRYNYSLNREKRN